MKQGFLVFGLLCCLYLLSSGGQGYSVDGTFSYQLAQRLVSTPWREALAQNRDTLKRWGPVASVLGVPFTWLGSRLGEWAPRRDSVTLDGHARRLYDWPAIGAPGAAAGDGVPQELTLSFQAPIRVAEVRLVSFLSLAAALDDNTPVAELVFQPGTPEGASPNATAASAAAPGQGRPVLRAGADTAEWAYDIPTADRPRHARSRLAGRWPGNPAANLYVAALSVRESGPVESLTLRYVAPAGRLHLRSVVITGPDGELALAGPPSWSSDEQAALFGRFGFSFLNAPLMALTCALLALLARQLGYSAGVAAVLATGFGVATMAWPYAKHDFSEAAATAFALGATLLLYIAYSHQAGSERAPDVARGPGESGRLGEQADTRARRITRRGGPTIIMAAGGLVALAAGAKYTAAWFMPLLTVQLVLLHLQPSLESSGSSTLIRAFAPASADRKLRSAGVSRFSLHPSFCTRFTFASRSGMLWELAAFWAPALAVLVAALLLVGTPPTLWSGWRGGLARGWLDFPLWAGLYGLLLSPGKSAFLYAPPLVLAVASAPAFVRRHGAASFVFVAVPLVYLLVFGSKGIWHGGGWGPRYLVPALPFAACLALPVIERAYFQGAAAPARRLWRPLIVLVGCAGLAVQVLAVAKHPNLYTVMFRDHIGPSLPLEGAPLGGAPALTYWRHFGGPGLDRQLARPARGADPSDPRRGLGFLFAERGSLELRLEARGGPVVEAMADGEVHRVGSGAFVASLYTCDWDRRGRRQLVSVLDGAVSRDYLQDHDFSGCEYLSWTVTAHTGVPLVVDVQATGRDVPVLSAIFFDPVLAPAAPGQAAPLERRLEPQLDRTTRGRWIGHYGADGYILFAWRRGAQDVVLLPPYIAGYSGGERVWIDTGEADVADTAVLYAPGFSPLAAHAWLLGSDVIAALFPANGLLQERALASPPWRYAHGLELHAPHPEYGLGLDFWPLLLRSHFSSHTRFMAVVWLVAGALALGGTCFAWALVRDTRAKNSFMPRPGATAS